MRLVPAVVAAGLLVAGRGSAKKSVDISLYRIDFSFKPIVRPPVKATQTQASPSPSTS